jgi:ATP-dependent protease HslVU (ClpYQ) ATPase subunit
MNRQFSLSLLVLVLASLAKVQSFAPAARRLCSTPVAADRVFGVVQPSATRVWMAEVEAEEEAEKSEDSKDEEVEVETKEESIDIEVEEESKEEEEEEKEDPEITAIKDEIAELESTLKSKRTTLAYTKDSADEYTKAGYARKVAEMENMRRVRSVSPSKACVAPFLSLMFPSRCIF